MRKKRIEENLKKVPCPACRGSGEWDGDGEDEGGYCELCGGTGWVSEDTAKNYSNLCKGKKNVLI